MKVFPDYRLIEERLIVFVNNADNLDLISYR